MFNSRTLLNPDSWKVNKIGVIGPGTIGLPMAALLADARIRIGSDKPAKVIVVQRDSNSSGWKKDAINNGTPAALTSETELSKIIARAVSSGLLEATHDHSDLYDADVILVCVRTAIKNLSPDYTDLLSVVKDLAGALKNKPAGKVPLVIFESTLAPTTVSTVIWDLFYKNGLTEGKNILLGYSPATVMPGNTVYSVKKCLKLAGGLHSETGKLIAALYKNIVTGATVHETNCLTAEIVKVFERGYREVKKAFSFEIAWFCGNRDIDFYALREKINEMLSDPPVVTGLQNYLVGEEIVVPSIGTGTDCIPHAGDLLWWRYSEAGNDNSESLILRARQINEESPLITFRQAENYFGKIKRSRIALLGVTNSRNNGNAENSPVLVMANYLKKKGFSYIMHDPFVKKDNPVLMVSGQHSFFTEDLDEAVAQADYIFMCTAHNIYNDCFDKIISGNELKGLMDVCNIFDPEMFLMSGVKYAGTGRGKEKPDDRFIEFVHESLLCIEKGLVAELMQLVEFYNDNFVFDPFNRVKFSEVYEFSPFSSSLYHVADPVKPKKIPSYSGFQSRLGLAFCNKREKYERHI